MKNHIGSISLLISMVPLLGALSGCGGGGTSPIATGTTLTSPVAATGTTATAKPTVTPVPPVTAAPLKAVTLDILAPNVGGHPYHGIDAYDAASGAEHPDQIIPSITSSISDNDLLAKSGTGTFYVQDYSVYPPTIYTVTGGTKQALHPLPTPLSYPSAAAAMTVLPNGHLVAATYVVSFGYNGFTTLQPDGTWSAYQQPNQYLLVRAMTVGTDGKLYVSGRQNGTERIDRYTISGDTLTFETTLISGPGNSQFGAIGFAHNGDMILADIINNQLVAYTSAGAPTPRVFPLPKLRRFVIGNSIFKQNDEVLFAVSQNGIYRVDYTTGSFVAVDKDGNSNPKTFLPSPGSGIFEDIVLN